MTSLLVQHAALIVTMDDADTRWLPTGRALLLASRSDKISSTRSGAQARTWIGMKNSVVLIVGAGPTGLALACDLRTRGIDVLVIDKAAGPATTSRALGLQARGREILARLGALGDLPERAIHGRATNVYVGKRRLMRFVVETQLGRVHLGTLLISQAEVEAELRRRLAELGGRVLWDH
jgi:2-polyprenyl-6-methoxyphenol hydroxylase-like FAD-dependent oxidoreductase